MRKTIEVGLGGDLDDPMTFFGGGGPVGRVKGGMNNVFKQEIKALNKLDDFNQARNKALEWLEERGFQAKKINYGGVKKTEGKSVGMKGNGAGFRVEYDKKNGAHINVFSGKEKGPHLKFDASEKTVEKIQKKYGRR